MLWILYEANEWRAKFNKKNVLHLTWIEIFPHLFFNSKHRAHWILEMVRSVRFESQLTGGLRKCNVHVLLCSGRKNRCDAVLLDAARRYNLMRKWFNLNETIECWSNGSSELFQCSLALSIISRQLSVDKNRISYVSKSVYWPDGPGVSSGSASHKRQTWFSSYNINSHITSIVYFST